MTGDKPKNKVCSYCSKTYKTTRAKQAYCSQECFFLNKKSDWQSLPKSKTCPQCGQVFYPKTDANKHAWRTQKFCSQNCSRAGKMAHLWEGIPQQKECAVCGETFGPLVRNSGSKESPKQFAARRTCCIKCRANANMRLVSVAGVQMNYDELARLVGKSVEVVRKKVQNGSSLAELMVKDARKGKPGKLPARLCPVCGRGVKKPLGRRRLYCGRFECSEASRRKKISDKTTVVEVPLTRDVSGR